MPRPADVVWDDASYLAMGSLIPMDPIRKMPLNVSPHHVMKVQHVEAVVSRYAAGDVIYQQHFMTKCV